MITNFENHKSQIILLLVSLSTLISLGGYIYYRFEAHQILIQKEQLITTIAQTKINQITSWYKSELNDAFIISKNPTIKKLVENITLSGNQKNLDNLQEFLIQIKNEHDYSNIIFATPSGLPILSTNNDSIIFTQLQKKIINQSIKNNEALSTGLYKQINKNNINIDFIAPIYNDGNLSLGALIFILDPNDFLLPLVNTWPVPSKTSESYIFMVTGDSLLFLSDIKYKSSAALDFSIPITNNNITATKGVQGGKGFYEGFDYRGERVFSFCAPIPGTPWFLISETDKSEVLQGLITKAIIILIITALLVVILGIGLSFIYNKRKANIFRNLYEREKDLRSLQVEFKTIMDSLGDGVITINTEGNLQYMNKTAEWMTDWNFNEAVDKQCNEVFRIINERTRQPELISFENVSCENSFDNRWRHSILITRSGKFLPVVFAVTPIFYEDSSQKGIAISFMDETAKKRQKLILQKSKLRLIKAQSTAKIGNWELSLKKRKLYCSNEVYKILELNNLQNPISLASVLNKVHPQDKSTVIQTFKKIIQKELFGNLDYRIVMSDASVKFIHIRWENHLNDKGIAFKVTGTIQDITERKEAEIKIRKSELFLSSILESIGDGVIVNTFPARNIIQINAAATKILGWSAKEVLNQNTRIFYKDLNTYLEYGERIEKGVQNKLPVIENELQLKHRNGNLIICEVISIIINGDNGPDLVINSFRNITERKQMISELIEAKNKAEESNRLKSAFLANMSHEIRTPLNGILGFSELLLNPELDRYKRTKYINILMQSGQRMLDTINDIIEVSRIDAGILEVENTEVNIPHLMEYFYDFFKPEIERKGLSLYYQNSNTTENLLIVTDSTKLNSIISNLIKNAIKFTSKGYIEFGWEISHDFIMFYVKDTGPGIPKNKIEKIFDRFVQGDHIHSTAQEGLGLGLSIASAYTELLGGKMWVQSQPELGSTFFFSIPYKQYCDPNSTINKTEASPLQTQNENITLLIAEDDHTNYLLLQEILKDSSFKLIRAKNGEEAVDLCRTQKNIDIILMDIKMPILNGLDATKKIRHFNKSIPIIAQTAYAFSTDKEMALNAGCNDYISKPIIREELIKIISKNIEGII